MDARPIGVFDSGVGGLTAVKELHKILPNEDIIYFGDTGRVPYGTRSRRTIQKYAEQDIRYLLGLGVKAVLAACGTVSTNFTEEQARSLGVEVPYTGVVPPAAADAAAATRGGRIGVIATPASIRTGAYQAELARIAPRAQVFAGACPLFVPLVENGMTARGDRITRLAAEMYLAPLAEQKIDTLILGCTHYPMLRDIIGDVLGPDVALIDSGASAAHHVRDMLERLDLLCGNKKPGSTRYHVTDTVEGFAQVAGCFLFEDVERFTEFVDLDSLTTV